MKIKILTVAATAVSILSSCVANAPMDNLVIDVSKTGPEISESMYGIFFEEINHAGDGGLLAELVENGSFEELEMPAGYHSEGNELVTTSNFNHAQGRNVVGRYRWTSDPVPGWVLKGDALMSLTKDSPKFDSAPNNLKITVSSGTAELENDGYWGMNIIADKTYTLRTIFRAMQDFNGSVTARLLAEDGTVIAEEPILKNGDGGARLAGDWQDSSISLVPAGSSKAARLNLAIEGAGTLYVDYVSLLPEDLYEYAGGKLPLRRDVAQMLIGLRPAFVRWPGGCVVEGISLANRFEWKKTLGDPAARSGEYSTWGYRCSYKLGYHEILSFCESIGANAMFVCNVGMGCQYRQGDVCKDEDIQYYLDDCLDAIEYAIGPVDSEWGAKRAEAGHPEAFPLKYVEIGNENWGADYERHYNIFHKAIKEKYPGLTLICNCNLRGIGSIEETDMIDPHWYVKPNFFFSNTHMFDNVERGKYTAYVGEYAANSDVGSGNMMAALSEAAWIGGMERNSDFVRMCSYAPLFENSNDRVWPVNLIWINSSQVLGRSSYYVQKMAAENRPDCNLLCDKYEGAGIPVKFHEGRIGLGSCETSVQFRDMTITTPDGGLRQVDLSGFEAKQGTWEFNDGILSQSDTNCKSMSILKDFEAEEFTVEFQFQRTGGVEGFYMYFGMDDEGEGGWLWSVGGWDDSITKVESRAKYEIITDSELKAERSVVKEGEWQNVRIEICKNGSKLFIDGEEILEYSPVQTCSYYCAGLDRKASEVVLKVVNSGSDPYNLGIRLDGVSKVSRHGKIIELSSSSPVDENTFEEPQKIFPSEGDFGKFGKDFTYIFPPYSYTVLRIPVQL